MDMEFGVRDMALHASLADHCVPGTRRPMLRKAIHLRVDEAICAGLHIFCSALQPVSACGRALRSVRMSDYHQEGLDVSPGEKWGASMTLHASVLQAM
jgi:hypothetical protein